MSNIIFSDEEEQQFKNAGSNSFPDGQYVGVLRDAEIRLVGRDANKRLLLKYEITYPKEFVGGVYTHFLPLHNVKAYGFLKMILSKFGIDTREIALRHLEDEMKEREGVTVNFKLVTDGKYQNPEIVSVIHEGKEGEQIPF